MNGLESVPRLRCQFCRREFPEDQWFARIRVGGQRAVFCRPQCVEEFFAQRAREGVPLFCEATGASEEAPLYWAPDHSVRNLFATDGAAYAV